HRPAVQVHADDTLRRVAVTLTEESIGAVVVRNPHPGLAWCGIVSERDVVEAVAGGLHPDRTRAADVMTADVAFAEVDEPLLAATQRMLANEIRHLPVVEDGVVVGVISARDSLQALADEIRDASRT
ncbi:MAG TPA: CBS domain-containing protein, partial [Acidimicrobiia bacterium]|nr:CBS domain-containing protein [Acidimicrobiia bacterium]